MSVPSTSITKALALIISITSWLPRQEFAYAVPFVFLAFWLLVLSLRGKQIRIGMKSLLWILGIASFISISTIHSAIRYDVEPLNMILWTVTHGSLVVALIAVCISKERALKTFYFLANVNILIGCFEAGLAWWQFAMGPGFADSSAAGDYVYGSLGNNSHLFAMKMLSLTIISVFMWFDRHQVRYIVATFLLLQAWLLGSAMHTVVVIAVAGVGYFFLVERYRLMKKLRIVLVSALSAVVVFASLALIQERNIQYMFNKFRMVNVANPDQTLYGKLEFMRRTLVDIPNGEGIDVALIGAGPGAYSSRASWILSGEYLGNQSFVPVSPSSVWKKYLYDLWNHELLDSARWAHGVANQPFATWFTILGEFGYIGLLLAVGGVVWLVACFLASSRSGQSGTIPKMSIFLIFFLCASFFFDNWLEYPRLMLPLVMLMGLSFKGVFGRGEIFYIESKGSWISPLRV